jgi:hypothetical protein
MLEDREPAACVMPPPAAAGCSRGDFVERQIIERQIPRFQ